MTKTPDSDTVRLTATVSGYVQGVGFRFSTRAVALAHQLVGMAENRPDDTVLVVAEGPRADCEALLDWLQGDRQDAMRRPGRVDFVDARFSPAEGGFKTFSGQ
ncbi:MAG: acylphosphatase [Candidatus Nanopelagicales bacterium]